MGIKTYRLELDAERHPVLIMENEDNYRVEPLDEPAKIVELCDKMMRLKYLAEENVVMIAVDTKGYILGIFKVSQGTVNSSFCNPREIYLRALVVGATAIFIVHNHPSGDCTPSSCDYSSLKQLDEAGKMIGVRLNDFIVVGLNSFFSARTNGILK